MLRGSGCRKPSNTAARDNILDDDGPRAWKRKIKSITKSYPSRDVEKNNDDRAAAAMPAEHDQGEKTHIPRTAKTVARTQRERIPRALMRFIRFDGKCIQRRSGFSEGVWCNELHLTATPPCLG